MRQGRGPSHSRGQIERDDFPLPRHERTLRGQMALMDAVPAVSVKLHLIGAISAKTLKQPTS